MRSISLLLILLLRYNVVLSETHKSDRKNIVLRSALDCPTLDGADLLTQTQLIDRLTHICRYDRLLAPFTELENGDVDPANITIRVHVHVLQNIDSSMQQFKMQGIFQVRFKDPRLAFENYAPKRRQSIITGTSLLDKIWLPHIFIANEESSSLLGTSNKNMLIDIAPDGMVTIALRVQAVLFCWMNFRKFPFDVQHCTTVLESWMYNTSIMQLHWETYNPLTIDTQSQLTEFELISIEHNESTLVSDPDSMHHGTLFGNYSRLSFSVLLRRTIGYYIMDYFLPSIMIVSISWVSFWLQADQTPARVTLGTTTLLSFITLSLSQKNNLSKVSYITLSEIWFLVCTLFIFGSLIEFAFVNAIWRRNRHVEVRKKSIKNIVKSTLRPHSRPNIDRKNSDTIISIDSHANIFDYLPRDADTDSNASKYSVGESELSAQDVALWIDRKMRFSFPLAFLVFNALFWAAACCL